MKKVTIVLEEKKLPHVQYENGNVMRSFNVYHDDLLHLIQQSTFEEEKKIETVLISPAFPPNTVKYGEKSDGTSIIFIQQPEASWDITYHRQSFRDVPFPNLIFGFRIKKQVLTGKFVVAYKDRFLRDKTPLYRFPYSNVYNEQGSMCFYENIEYKDLVQLQTFIHRWIHTDMNDHLYGADVNLSGKPLRQLFEEMSGESFNYDILKPINLNFEEWSNSLINKF